MKRTLLCAALLAGAVLSADVASAQSNTRGFMLNAHLVGASIGGTPEGADAESGGGLGVAVGYGFSDLLTLYLNVDAAEYEYEDGVDEDGDDGKYAGATVDLGLRINFGSDGQRLRPYLTTGLAGVGMGDEAEGSELVIGGAGLTLGAGLQYFLTPGLALDGALNFTTGSFTSIEFNGEEEDLEDGIGFNHGRLQLGVTWHP